MVIFSIVMGIGGVIVVWPDVVGFFTFKHKTELDRSFEDSTRTYEQGIKRRKWRERGAIILVSGLVSNIIYAIFLIPSQ